MGAFYLLHDDYALSIASTGGTLSSVASATGSGGIFLDSVRARPWRSAGNFIVVASSDRIVFQETIGVNLTATITAGTYATRTLFLAAVKTALDAAGASTYTVTTDTTTLKSKITSDGLGGGGVFRLIWTHANSAAMAALLGYSTAADDTGALTYTADSLVIHSYESITYDMGQTLNPKAFVLIGPRNGTIKLTDSALIKIQGNETNTWTSPSFSQTIAYEEKAIMHFDSDGMHTGALRYWRVYIQDQANPLGYIEVSRVYLGDAFYPSRGAVQFPFESTLIDNAETVSMESGDTFADIGRIGQRFSARYAGLTYTDIETLIDVFNDYGLARPLYFVADSSAVFSSAQSYYTRYVRFTSAPSYRLVSPNNFEITFEFTEVV